MVRLGRLRSNAIAGKVDFSSFRLRNLRGTDIFAGESYSSSIVLITCLRRFRLIALTAAMMQVPVQAQDDAKAPTVAVVLPDSAFDVTRSLGSCESVKYSAAAPYPATAVESYIGAKLGANGWSRLSLDAFNSEDVPIPSEWSTWTNGHGEVHTRKEQWSTKSGDIVAYKFWYFAPDMNTLKVDARFCSAAQLEHIYHHVHCPPQDAASLSKKSYKVSAKITNIEPVENGFRVHYRLENTGDEKIYIASLGKWPDGSQHLQTIGVEQREDGEWGNVGNECVEHTPVAWEILNPRDVLDGWTLAVSFAEPNHRFGMCTRRIAGLKGPVRVSVGFSRSICEIQNILQVNNRLGASSSAVELPVSQR
jgi:hypothetical protein